MVNTRDRAAARGAIMGDDGASVPARRRLVAELKRARNAKGLTQSRTAEAMEWSQSKIQRIEKGSSGIKTNDLRVLLQFYGITDKEQRDQLLELARDARKPSWWSEYRDNAPKELLTLIDYESMASVIRQFETVFIPGILQTEEYARAVLEIFYDEKTASGRVDALVELRKKRQELLSPESGLSFYFVLDESAIRRVVGGYSGRRLQLYRLIEVAKSPNVTIEVVPFSAGINPGMKGPFEIIEFADESDEDLVFEENSRGDTFLSDSAAVTRHREVFERLEKVSLNPDDTVALLRNVADETT
jgi:transcriptional regulator with XRE-family HTH domain